MDKQTITVLATVILLSAAATLAIKSCKDKKQLQEATFTQKQIDSVKSYYEGSSKIIDTLVSKNNKITGEKDSLAKVVLETLKKLEIQTLKVKVLVREAQLARLEYDDTSAVNATLNYIASCDALLPQIDSLITLADKSRMENRALQNSYDSLLSVNSLRIARLEFDNAFIGEKFDKVSANALILEGAVKKLDRKASKRFAVTAGGGYIFDGYKSKLGVFAGIGWTPIRF